MPHKMIPMGAGGASAATSTSPKEDSWGLWPPNPTVFITHKVYYNKREETLF